MKTKLLKFLGFVAALALFCFGSFAHADVTNTFWNQTSPNVLMTNTGNGLANADIHVANCWIGPTTDTPCGGPSGLTEVSHDASLQGDGTSGDPLGVDTSWFDGRFDTDFGLKTTDDLTEGITNLYWTQTRFNNAFSAKTTDDLPEGLVNFYFTDARAQAANAGLWVGLTGDETVAGTKLFEEFPQKDGSLTPIFPQDFVTKDYADAVSLGFRFKQSVIAGTVAPLPAVTYDNGIAGVGATLTANTNGLIPQFDSYTVSAGDRVLVKNQADATQNGIYDVSDEGSDDPGGTPFVLTRSADFDSTATIGQGSATLVLNGTAWNPPTTTGNMASQFAVLTADPITVGTDFITWSRISLPIQYFAGAGLTLTGTTFSVNPTFSPIAVANGTTLYSLGLSGTGTGNASGNNIMFGVNAGASSTNVFNSIFLGTDSGNVATNAFQSVFIGIQAGYQATFAQSSVFLGTGAGFNASSASGSNFIGRDVGSGAVGAFNSNFFGNSAGANAGSAQHANFFGVAAGQNATSAFYSTFIGDQAGQNSTTAANSICIGSNACRNDFVNNTVSGTSIAIGDNSGTGGFSNSIAIGAGAQNSAINQLMLGSGITQVIMPSVTSMGLGVFSPTARLHLGAGTNALAPLKFTSGTNTGTPQAGSEEYNGTSFFLTNSSAVRQTIPLTQPTRVTAAFSRTSSTVLTNVTGLTATVAAGRFYKFEAYLYTTSNVAGGVKAAIAGTATATNVVIQGTTINNTATSSSRAAALGAAVGPLTAVTVATIHITGTIQVNAAGTLTVQFGQNVSNAAASTVIIGSTFVVTQVP